MKLTGGKMLHDEYYVEQSSIRPGPPTSRDPNFLRQIETLGLRSIPRDSAMAVCYPRHPEILQLKAYIKSLKNHGNKFSRGYIDLISRTKMDATICPFDLVLFCRTSENAAASEIGHFPPAWDQSIPRSDYYSNKAPFYENYYGKDPPGLFFDDPALSPLQSTAVSSPESDCISSPILDVEMALNFWDTSMDIMEPIPWDLSLDQPTYGGLPTSDLTQDVQTASDYTRITAYRQQSDAFSLGTVASNPWAEPGPDEAQEEDHISSSRQKRTARSRRQKRDNRKSSETSLAGSASTGGGAPSVSDAASPSSTSQDSRASNGSESTSMASTASTASSRQAKLRSASRTSKNSHSRPNDTPKERRTRASHNLVEKQYRNRLNAQFESLLSALPEQLRAGNNGNGDTDESEGNDADRRVSKGEVLEMARKHIQLLEQERAELERENLELHGNLRRLKGSASDGTVSSSSQETPLDFKADADGKKQADDQDKS